MQPVEVTEGDSSTDSDSECEMTLGRNDFRLRTSFTRGYRTPEGITQCWRLSPQEARLDLLLQSTDAPEWKFGPSVFSVRIDDIREVAHNQRSLVIRVTLRSGGWVSVSLNTERTRRRLLELLWSKNKALKLER